MLFGDFRQHREDDGEEDQVIIKDLEWGKIYVITGKV